MYVRRVNKRVNAKSFAVRTGYFNTVSFLIPDKSKLLLDISARLWFTYRRKFSPIGAYTFSALLS